MLVQRLQNAQRWPYLRVRGLQVDKERPYVLFLALVEFLAVHIAQPLSKTRHNHFVGPDSGSRLVEIPILHRRIDSIDFVVTVRA